MEIEYGYCHCGCGQKTAIAKKTRTRWGHIKGQPVRFILSHASRKHNNCAYKFQYVGNYKADQLHRIIAEKALGHKLPNKAEVHHINGNGRDNQNCNLVICQDRMYHRLLHLRQNALIACGNPTYIKCTHCKKYDDPINLYMIPGRNQGYHRGCHAEIASARYKARIRQ